MKLSTLLRDPAFRRRRIILCKKNPAFDWDAWTQKLDALIEDVPPIALTGGPIYAGNYKITIERAPDRAEMGTFTSTPPRRVVVVEIEPKPGNDAETVMRWLRGIEFGGATVTAKIEERPKDDDKLSDNILPRSDGYWPGGLTQFRESCQIALRGRLK